MGLSWWQRLRSGAGHPNEPWWFQGWRKVREWSSKVAVSLRWKVLVRRFRHNLGGRDGRFGDRQGKQFRYDPLSYAMNFDDDHHDEDRPDFSSRYAAIPTERDSRPLFS